MLVTRPAPTTLIQVAHRSELFSSIAFLLWFYAWRAAVREREYLESFPRFCIDLIFSQTFDPGKLGISRHLPSSRMSSSTVFCSLCSTRWWEWSVDSASKYTSESPSRSLKFCKSATHDLWIDREMIVALRVNLALARETPKEVCSLARWTYSRA